MRYIRVTFISLLVQFFTIIIFGQLLLAQRIESVAVLELEGSGISAGEATTLTNRMRSELARTDAVTVVEREKVQEIIAEKDLQLTGLTSDKFAVEIGKILGATTMIAGSIGKIGATYTIEVRSIDVESGTLDTAISGNYQGEIDGLLREIEQIAWEMVGLVHPDKAKEQISAVLSDVVLPERTIHGEVIDLNKFPPWEVIELNKFGTVHYSKWMVYSTGIGAVRANAPNVGAARAGAIMAARVDALRNLVEAVKAVRVTSETTVSNNMVENDIVRTKVEAMVRGARQVGEVKYLSDASVEVNMALPLSGIMDLVLPAANIAPPLPVTKAALTNAGQRITGLIIDTRGLGIKPSMSPRVLADDGSVLYGPGKYPRDFAVTQGVVGYHKDIEAARDEARVAGNPLTIRGTRTSGTLATDVVISMSVAQQAAGFDGFADAIGNCRVMFILD